MLGWDLDLLLLLLHVLMEVWWGGTNNATCRKRISRDCGAGLWRCRDAAKPDLILPGTPHSSATSKSNRARSSSTHTSSEFSSITSSWSSSWSSSYTIAANSPSLQQQLSLSLSPLVGFRSSAYLSTCNSDSSYRSKKARSHHQQQYNELWNLQLHKARSNTSTTTTSSTAQVAAASSSSLSFLNHRTAQHHDCCSY